MAVEALRFKDEVAARAKAPTTTTTSAADKTWIFKICRRVRWQWLWLHSKHDLKRFLRAVQFNILNFY